MSWKLQKLRPELHKNIEALRMLYRVWHQPDPASIAEITAWAKETNYLPLPRETELSIALALSLQSIGKTIPALEMLRGALERSEARGFIHIFNQGARLNLLLAQAAGQEICTTYVNELLSIFRHRTTSVQAPSSNSPVVRSRPAVKARPNAPQPGHLSSREMDILRLIDQGLTNPEIAAKLYIEVSTVKRHINHIFSKLGVTSRTQALVKGKKLGIL